MGMNKQLRKKPKSRAALHLYKSLLKYGPGKKIVYKSYKNSEIVQKRTARKQIRLKGQVKSKDSL